MIDTTVAPSAAQAVAPKLRRADASAWVRAAACLGRTMRQLPGGRKTVDTVRHWRLQYLAKCHPKKMSRYEMDQLVAMAVDCVVIEGPFRGMRYLNHACGSVLSAKLLGSYERELHGWIAEIFESDYQQVVVVGSGEGFYAVGLALKLRNSTIIAVDIDEQARAATDALAKLNRVQNRVTVSGATPLSEVVGDLSTRNLIICDIEGCEREWLTESSADLLQRTDLLVEVHDDPSSTKTLDSLLAHFAKTHRFRLLNAQPRDPQLVNWPKTIRHDEIRRRLIDECRLRGTRWIFLQPFQFDALT